MAETTMIALGAETVSSIQQMAQLAVKQIVEALQNPEEPTKKDRLAIQTLSNLTRLVQTQNSAARLHFSALQYCGFKSPEERQAYIAATFPALNLVIEKK